MQHNEIDQILASVKAPLTHPLFYPRVFALVAKRKKRERRIKGDLIQDILSEEYEELSRRLDRSQIQASCSVRNVLRAREMASLIINEKGEINLHLIPEMISHLEKNLYSLGPQRQYDAKRQEHLLKVLHLLNSQKEIVRLIKAFTKPYANKWAEELIRQTLLLSPQTILTDAHAKQAALSAWLCYLRQNVGSCFATAPAIIIHDEQPEQFLQDLLDLIATGRLKRTFGGVENSVPLSASWGSGDLKKPLLIKISSQGIVPEIWHSPGLAAAFTASGLLKKEESLKAKVQQLEGWISNFIRQSASSFIVITVEEIIRIILLQSLGLTEKQIKEHEARPSGLIPTPLVRHDHQPKKGGVRERCSHFLQLFEQAKNAFRSLADNPLLKAWEYTLASFSDIKSEFTRWNLYASLGLEMNEPGGIGQLIYQTIQQKLNDVNRQLEEIQLNYEMVYTQVKTLESRLQQASTEKEVQWLKIEYQSRKHEFYFLEEQRNEFQKKAKALVNLYESLYKLYADLFKEYFQEVYDADMQEVSTAPFDDSPAGFRLLYNHGRSNTSQWTLIKNQYDFIDSLVSFFVATEPQIVQILEERKIEKDLSDVVTTIINHIKTKEFLESAFFRMAKIHHVAPVQNPLENLDQIEKKPWAYTSGGTMHTLVSCYYRLEEKPAEVEKWVESEMELLVFLADTLKHIPHSHLRPFLAGKRDSILMQSPTHAFLLKPLLSPFKEAWSLEEFTYTSIRDRFVLPAEIFVEGLLLSDEMLKYLLEQLVEKIPENYRPRFKQVFGSMRGPLSALFFRETLTDMLEQDRGLRYGSHPILSNEEIDSFLYASLPLTSLSDLRDRLEKILHALPGLTTEKTTHILQLFNLIPLSRIDHPFIGAQHLQDIVKALLCLSDITTACPYNYHLHACLAAQNLGFAMPAPLLFADTNWVKEMFGFVVNPGTGKLELWRLDETGSVGYPMTSWRQWVNGSRHDRKWGVYVKSFQYGQSS